MKFLPSAISRRSSMSAMAVSFPRVFLPYRRTGWARTDTFDAMTRQ